MVVVLLANSSAPNEKQWKKRETYSYTQYKTMKKQWKTVEHKWNIQLNTVENDEKTVKNSETYS